MPKGEAKEKIMLTDWIQTICSILTTVIAAIGVFRNLPKVSKDINNSTNEKLDKLEQQWKRLIDLYAKNPAMREYSNLNGVSSK